MSLVDVMAAVSCSKGQAGGKKRRIWSTSPTTLTLVQSPLSALAPTRPGPCQEDRVPRESLQGGLSPTSPHHSWSIQ